MGLLGSGTATLSSMSGVDEFGSELADFRSRVEELRSARAIPETEPSTTLDAALFELQHAADVLWPRYEALAAAGRRGVESSDPREQRLLRALFQRLPVPVVLVDRDGVVRRLNVAASELFAVRAGYASGRPLTGAIAHADRTVFRSQVAAVARGEGSRSLRVQLLRPPKPDNPASGNLRATLTALRPPREPRSAVLCVFQPAAHTPPPASPGSSRTGGGHAPRGATPRPSLPEMTRHAELLDLIDDMAAELLVSASAEEACERAAALLHRRFADWVIIDTRMSGSGELRRALVLSSGGGQEMHDAVAAQDPALVPMVADAVERGAESLEVRPEGADVLGHDANGAPVLVRAEVSSLICLPLAPSSGPGGPERRNDGPALGALTLLRTGGRRVFELAEAGAVARMARHLALTLRRYAAEDSAEARSVSDGSGAVDAATDGAAS